MFFNVQILLKYVLLAILVGATFKVLPDLNLSNEIILNLTLLIVIYVFVVDNVLFSRMEGMDNVKVMSKKPLDYMKCGYAKVRLPGEYDLTPLDENQIDTNIRFDIDLPKQDLVANEKIPIGGIPYCEMDEAIYLSKLKKIMQQHNYNIPWSPHTHIGKARSYLNWDKVFE